MREPIQLAQRGQALADFHDPRAPIDAERELKKIDRQRLVETFIKLVEGLYVHLPLKRAMYGKDPVQRLRLLRQRAEGVSEAAFHGELSTILTELRDAHTRYVGPRDWRGLVAVLPFMVEMFGPADSPHFLVSNVAEEDPAFEGTSFGPNAEVLWWNGMPTDRAVERYADRETGGRPDARRARALESLTFRALGYGPPPDEYWVQVGYRAANGDQGEEEVRIDWRVVDISRDTDDDAGDGVARMAYAGDPSAEAVRRAKKLLFAPNVWYEHERGEQKPIERGEKPAAGQWITGTFQDNVAAKIIETPSGRFGYLRLWSFNLIDDDGFLEEVSDLLGMLPTRGLIIDIRANPGGLIWAAERMLQLFTPNEVAPTRFSLLATDLTRAMADAPQNAVRLEPWRRSLKTAVANGEPYSRSVPLTPPALCRDIGQRYGGPVVCIVDANTYSAGDLFAAGFVDNQIGPMISIGEATGAGGANVWTPGIVERALAGTDYALPPLPEGISYTISVRRALRSGTASGTVIEDLGVPGHLRYELTRRDLTESNVDLLAYCGALLVSEPFTDLVVERLSTNVIQVKGEGIDRVDVYADLRPLSSMVLGEQPIEIELPESWSEASVRGYAGQTLRQRRLIQR